jgi:hypothetical protein
MAESTLRCWLVVAVTFSAAAARPDEPPALPDQFAEVVLSVEGMV